MAEQIAIAVTSATQELQRSLVDHLTLSIDQTSQRLEARIARSREQNEGMLNSIKDEQIRFQEEMKSSLSSLRGMDQTYRFGVSGSGSPQKTHGSQLLGDVGDESRPEGSVVGSGRMGGHPGAFGAGGDDGYSSQEQRRQPFFSLQLLA
ncbi:hypothetical protein DCAR_0205736 [Daucus carota subsp. sativus]|uniref:Uncharacterized protein n=1 Tax=Daucus carota subsp. sativus TaxID=79200 RepID=A0A175YCM4_DAUCS|nr:hypothetical protein DCAR_0205736 [Daucus carota subsp. sativus]